MLDQLKATLGIEVQAPPGWRSTNVAGYRVEAKLAGEPTPVGINGGRVIKLDVYDGDELVVHYDREIDLHDIPLTTVNQIVSHLEGTTS